MREIRAQLLQKVFSFWGTSPPCRPPTGAPSLGPAGGPRPPDCAPPQSKPSAAYGRTTCIPHYF